MHVQRVVTNETCNQNCWFCNGRRASEDPSFIRRAAVHARIDAALSQSPREIVLTGGEPALRRDLVDLVKRAARDGVRVVLETNGVWIDPARARALADAGLSCARVALVAWGQEADAITREPGGFAAALRGIEALQEAGIPVEITTPIVRRNLSLVGALPRALHAAGLRVAALVLLAPTSAPDPEECAPLTAIAEAITRIADASRAVGLTVRLDPTTFLPPCLFEKPERVAHLYALNRGNAQRRDFERIDACTDCLVNDRCPGLPIGRELAAEEAAPRPILEQRMRRRLTFGTSVEEQIARELVGRDELRNSAYGQVAEYTIRVNFHCNQACEFCFVSTHLPPPAERAVRDAIESAGRENAVVVLSGGEPTLNPRLVEYVALAKRSGALAVELQTNAIRLADSSLAAELVDAGLAQAMVSLHGSTAEISDAITCAPGTFDATVLGIDALARTSVRLRLNFVFCQANYADFPRLIDLVARRWPQAAIVFSFVGSHTDVVPRTTQLIPSFSDVMPALLDGLERARAAGIDVDGFDSMCGLPLCLVPEEDRASFSTIAIASDAGAGEFVKAESCVECAEAYRCYGVRRGYAELYGTGELRPLRTAATASATPAHGSSAA